MKILWITLTGALVMAGCGGNPHPFEGAAFPCPM